MAGSSAGKRENKCWVAVMGALLIFRWPLTINKLKYLKSYGRKSSKRLFWKAAGGSFHVMYFELILLRSQGEAVLMHVCCALTNC